MRFLVDICAGRRLADWLRGAGHDVVEAHTIGKGPGDAELLRLAAREARILVTIDTDLGALVVMGATPHCGIVRLPDVPSGRRMELMAQLLARHREEELADAIIVIRGDRICIARWPAARL